MSEAPLSERKIIQIAVGGDTVFGLSDDGAVYWNTYKRDGTRGWQLLIAVNELALAGSQGEQDGDV